MKRLAGVLAFALAVCTLVVDDVRQDRKHVVTIKSQTPIFAGSGDGFCGGQRLTVVQAGAVFPVRRIRYWKNCASVDVVLPDARHGYLVLGEGQVTVSPPLP